LAYFDDLFSSSIFDAKWLTYGFLTPQI